MEYEKKQHYDEPINKLVIERYLQLWLKCDKAQYAGTIPLISKDDLWQIKVKES